MKYLKFSMILPALFLSNIIAQAAHLNPVTTDPKSGIYLTAADYKNKQLHLAGDQSTNNKLRLNDFFGGKTLRISHNGENHEFSKDSIYGYRDKDGSDYRFYKSYSTKYKILENGSVVIYKTEQAGNKQTGFKPLVQYYFSNGVAGEIHLLSLANLKRTFKDQPAFDIIDANFQTDSDLIKYDDEHHLFRINRFLAKL
ncbi:hypothetical protein AY601_1615 [Pedobacter cryoconitis]|uniref:Uncharacterized protein n=1 Tax=Pedobacter cryoconitis TaxID=188932 RepID=A0A127VBE0_9SPHI|nr:hypothetical protein [Pedobacter cryoconitis]AMP98530.1 hypothetical protein AY601_1615 [Pedobacter cryoconitis]